MIFVRFSATPTAREQSKATDTLIATATVKRATSIIVYTTTHVAASPVITATSAHSWRVLFIVGRIHFSNTIPPVGNYGRYMKN
jgi:hypothetical protein